MHDSLRDNRSLTRKRMKTLRCGTFLRLRVRLLSPRSFACASGFYHQFADNHAPRQFSQARTLMRQEAERTTRMNRDDAWGLVCQFTQSDSLRKHMLAVEAAVRTYARKFGEDEEKWRIVGLLHDFDYERWPDPPNHPLKGAEILARHGYPDDVIYAIVCLNMKRCCLMNFEGWHLATLQTHLSRKPLGIGSRSRNIMDYPRGYLTGLLAP